MCAGSKWTKMAGIPTEFQDWRNEVIAIGALHDFSEYSTSLPFTAGHQTWHREAIWYRRVEKGFGLADNGITSL